MVEIKINNEVYNLKYSLRGLFYFENISQKSFSEFSTNLLDVYILFYAFLLSSNPDKNLITFDELIDACDKDTTLITQFNKFFTDAQNRGNELLKEQKEDKSSSKSKKK